jgi:hypothetical protein
MLLNRYDLSCGCILIFFLLVWGITGYTYRVNSRRKADDPKKQDYAPLAVLIAPITTPILLAGALSFFILRALLFTVFLIIFAILLLVVRKPFIFKLWDKFATWVGDPLLKVNTYLVRMAFRAWNPSPQNMY